MRLSEGTDLPSQLQHICRHHGQVQFCPWQGVACTHQLAEVGVVSFPSLAAMFTGQHKNDLFICIGGGTRGAIAPLDLKLEGLRPPSVSLFALIRLQ